MKILYLNENPLPHRYTKGAVAGKELRLRASMDEVEKIRVISFKGRTVNDNGNTQIGWVEAKVDVILLTAWPYYSRWLPLFVYGMVEIIKFKPDLIEAESPILSGLAGVFLGKIFKLPVVVEVRASYDQLIKYKAKWLPYGLKKILLEQVMGLVLAMSSLRLVNSRFYQQQLKSLGLSSVVINPGVCFENEEHKRNQISKTRVIGYMGRLEIEKGCGMLLDAMAWLEKEKLGENLDYKLLIAGEGSKSKQFKKQAKRLGLSRVEFVGFKPSEEFLRKIEILVNPNLVMHPLEMVNAEGAWFGIPVICFGNAKVPETVISGKTGLVVERVSEKSLATALLKLITDNRLRLSLGKNGQSFARDNFSFDKQVQALRQGYVDAGIMAKEEDDC